MATLCYVLTTREDKLWQKLPSDPADPEVQRHIAITKPIIWLNEPR